MYLLILCLLALPLQTVPYPLGDTVKGPSDDNGHL